MVWGRFYLSLAVEIEPEKDRACVAVRLSEGAIGDKQSAIPPGNAGNATLLVAPIEGEAQRVDVVGSSFIDVGRGDLRDSSGERHAVNRSTSTRLSDPRRRRKIGKRQERRINFLHQFAILFGLGFHGLPFRIVLEGFPVRGRRLA